MDKNILNSNNDDRLLTICNQISIGFHVNKDEIEIFKFDQGLVSEIYRIVFKNKQKQPIIDNVQIKQLVIKLFRPNPPYNPNESKINSLIIGENNLGPKIYLIGDDYIVMEYLDAKPFNRQNDCDEKFFQLLAERLARFHSLQVPIEKNSYQKRYKYIFEEWADEKYWNKIYGINNNIDKEKTSILINTLIKNNCNTIIKNNVQMECNFLRKQIENINPIIVFCHQDLNHSNIFLINNENMIKFIDFDYSGYNHRCMDIGRYFSACEKFKQYSNESIIDDDKMLRFINYYLNENYRIYGDDYYRNERENLSKKLLNESKLFVLFAQMIDVLFCLWEAMVEPNYRQKYCILAESRYNEYQKFKMRIKKDNIFIE